MTNGGRRRSLNDESRLQDEDAAPRLERDDELGVSGDLAKRPAASGATSRGFDFSEEVGYLLRRAYQHHTAVFQRLNGERQLTTTVQFAILWALDKLGPSSLRGLGRAASLDGATTRAVVDRLAERGLVKVEYDPGDRRKVVVELTEDGSQLLDRMLPFSRQIAEETLQELNPAERLAFLFCLRKLTP